MRMAKSCVTLSTRDVFLVRSASDDLQRVIRQQPLQRLRLVPLVLLEPSAASGSSVRTPNATRQTNRDMAVNKPVADNARR